MQSDHILSVEDTNAVRNWVVALIVARFASFDEPMKEAYTRVAANRVLEQADTDTLLSRIMKRVMEVLPEDVGRDLATIARVSREALVSEDSVRRWLNDTHRAALANFHAISSDYRPDRSRSRIWRRVVTCSEVRWKSLRRETGSARTVSRRQFPEPERPLHHRRRGLRSRFSGTRPAP